MNVKCSVVDDYTVTSDVGDGVQVYAVLREDWTSGGGHTVCATRSVVDVARLVYTSTSNVVEARLVTQSSTSRQFAHFLIKVECNAPFTCPY